MFRTIQFKTSVPKPEAVVVALAAKTKRLSGEARLVDEECGGAIRKALKRAEVKLGKAGTVVTLYPPDSGKRILVLGLGDRKTADEATALRAASSKLTKALDAANVNSVRVRVDGRMAKAEAGRILGEGMGLALVHFHEHKGTATANKRRVAGILKVGLPKSMLVEAKRGLVAAESANAARELAATPPNVANPAYLASLCRRMAKKVGLRCTVIDDRKAAELGMGGLVAVGKAGSTPSKLIVLEHRPPGTAKQAPVLLVGKAITFDTGGYSLKPVTGITSMKYDKCGGAAVIGAMRAVAELNLPIPVVALIPAAENMIDTIAYRPDDILTMVNGVTVEVVSTDAEGRLVLGDALAYGCGKYKPRAVIDLATLTGGVVVALGKLAAGAFCNDDQLMRALESAGEAAGERLWRLPIWKEYRKIIKSEHADIKNVSGREAHPTQGAVFLSHFVAKDGDFTKNDHVPWAHLDIAGVANVDGGRDHLGLYPKGPTGFGVRLLVQALEAMAAKK